MVSSGWHTYGVEITSERMSFYVGDRACWSMATPATLDTDPMFMINLAAGGGWAIAPDLNDMSLYVDYFRACEAQPAKTQPVASVGPTLSGTSGNDAHFLKDSNTHIVESANGGYGSVRSYVSYVFPTNVAKIVLTEKADINATGNGEVNEINGNNGANVLSGLGGDDRIFGGAGNDILIGGAGDGRLMGQDGNDVSIGGSWGRMALRRCRCQPVHFPDRL